MTKRLYVSTLRTIISYALVISCVAVVFFSIGFILNDCLFETRNESRIKLLESQNDMQSKYINDILRENQAIKCRLSDVKRKTH